MPRFQFYCQTCDNREDRFCLNEEKDGQFCLLCGEKMVYEFVPTRSRPVVYANDTKHPRQFTGPKQRERYLKDRNLIDYGSESPDTVRKFHENLDAEADAKRDHEVYETVMEGLSELGDAGLYQSVPAHVAKREERLAREEARDRDLTGAALGRPDGSD